MSQTCDNDSQVVRYQNDTDPDIDHQIIPNSQQETEEVREKDERVRKVICESMWIFTFVSVCHYSASHCHKCSHKSGQFIESLSLSLSPTLSAHISLSFISQIKKTLRENSQRCSCQAVNDLGDWINVLEFKFFWRVIFLCFKEQLPPLDYSAGGESQKIWNMRRCIQL